MNYRSLQTPEWWSEGKFDPPLKAVLSRIKTDPTLISIIKMNCPELPLKFGLRILTQMIQALLVFLLSRLYEYQPCNRQYRRPF